MPLDGTADMAAECARLLAESRAELERTAPTPGLTLAGAQPFLDTDSAREMLQRASTRTAAGPDELSGSLLRLAAGSPTYVELLRDLVNFCWCFHVLPQGWRDANVTPLPKKDAPPDEPGGYRPISVTSILARQLERVVKTRYEPQLEPTLSHWQGGFRQRRSTRQQVLYLREMIGRAMRRERPGASRREGRYKKTDPYPVVFLDIQRAFDSAPHELLLASLFRAGLRGDALHYFRSFLSGRRFRVVAGDTIGEWAPVRAGVPQGAVLSPLLYAIFIDLAFPEKALAMAFVTDCGELLYADDGACAPPIEATLLERYRALQHQLDALGAWAACWGVRFSAKKSAVVWFHPLQMGSKARAKVDSRIAELDGSGELHIPYGGGPRVLLPAAKEYQYLGVWLTQDLSSDRQYLHIVERTVRVSAMIRALIAPGRPPGFQVIRTLVQVMLVSRITYALPFMSLTRKQSARLNALMLQPVYSSLALPHSTHRASLACASVLPTVEVLFPAECMKLMVSILATAFPASDTRRARLDTHPPLRLVAQALLPEAERQAARNSVVAAEARRNEVAQEQSAGRDRAARLARVRARALEAELQRRLEASRARYTGSDARGRMTGGGLHRCPPSSESEVEPAGVATADVGEDDAVEAAGRGASDGSPQDAEWVPRGTTRRRPQRRRPAAGRGPMAEPAPVAGSATGLGRAPRWRSTVQCAAEAFATCGIQDVLPEWATMQAATRPAPGGAEAQWNVVAARQQVRQAAATLSSRRVMEEAEGADHLYGGVHAGAAFGSSHCGPRGVRMAQWLGLPPATAARRSTRLSRSSRHASVRAAHRQLLVRGRAAAAPASMPPFLAQRQQAHNTTGRTLQLRMRLLLNRSNLAGEGANVRMARVDARRCATTRERGEPPPAATARPLLCTMCSANLPETLDHVLLDCTAHLYHRTLWEVALSPLVQKVQAASQSYLEHPLHALAATAADTLKLLLLASPLVVNTEILTRDEVVTALSIGDRAHVEIDSVRPL